MWSFEYYMKIIYVSCGLKNWMKDDHRSYIRIIILSWVYNEPIQRPAPSWLVSLIGRVLHQYCAEVKSSNPVQAWKFFSGFLFAAAKVVYITAMIILVNWKQSLQEYKKCGMYHDSISTGIFSNTGHCYHYPAQY